MLDPSVFKAYDVRGVYPTELDEQGAYATARAYVEEFRPARIAVGRDMRLVPLGREAVGEEGRRLRIAAGRPHQHEQDRDAGHVRDTGTGAQ